MRKALPGILLFIVVFSLISIDIFAGPKGNIKLESMQPNGLFYFSCYVHSQENAITLQVRKVASQYISSSNTDQGYSTDSNPKIAAQKSCNILNGIHS